jgi:hypothetical protein
MRMLYRVSEDSGVVVVVLVEGLEKEFGRLAR